MTNDFAGAAPRLETARLILRPAHVDDLPAQAAMMADLRVVRHLGGAVLSREEAWRKWLVAPGLWALLGYGYWAVALRSGGAMIGQLGFADFKRDLAPNIENIPEMGWSFAAGASGQGYATEAGRAALAWIDAALGPPEIAAIIDAGNTASIRVAEKLGFTHREEALYRGEPILLFRRR